MPSFCISLGQNKGKQRLDNTQLGIRLSNKFLKNGYTSMFAC